MDAGSKRQCVYMVKLTILLLSNSYIYSIPRYKMMKEESNKCNMSFGNGMLYVLIVYNGLPQLLD